MFLKDIELIREKYGRDCVYVDIPYVRHPNFMDCKIMKEGYMIKESVALIFHVNDQTQNENSRFSRLF